MGKLDGKAVVVTGASRGMSAEIARVFGAEGGAHHLRRPHGCTKASTSMRARSKRRSPRSRTAGGEATGVAVGHLASRRSARAWYKQRATPTGPVDVLVNNAALTYFVPIKDYPINRWMRSWAVNFHAPFILSQLVLGEMVGRRSGFDRQHLVRCGDRAGTRAVLGPRALLFRGSTCYGAEKAALERFTQGLAARGVRLRRVGHLRLTLRRSCRRRAPCITSSSAAWMTRAASRRC